MLHVHVSFGQSRMVQKCLHFRFGKWDVVREGVQGQLSREEERARRHECLDYAFWTNHMGQRSQTFDFDEQGVEEEVQVGGSYRGGIYTRRRCAQKMSSPASSIRHNHDRLHFRKNAQEDKRVSDVPFGQSHASELVQFLILERRWWMMKDRNVARGGRICTPRGNDELDMIILCTIFSTAKCQNIVD
jgi:hypothetical protein